jgi:hypothetical protein
MLCHALPERSARTLLRSLLHTMQAPPEDSLRLDVEKEDISLLDKLADQIESIADTREWVWGGVRSVSQ